MGVKVFGAEAQSVKENVELFKEIKLQELTMDHSCRAHAGGCGHEKPKPFGSI